MVCDSFLCLVHGCVVEMCSSCVLGVCVYVYVRSRCLSARCVVVVCV